jgi:hypothetical protein
MGWVAGAAGIAFGLALVLLVTFFATKDSRFDRVAEWCFVAFGLLAVPTVLAAAERLSGGGAITQAGTALGVAGAVGIGLGELGSSLRLVDFRRIATPITVAFLAFLAWIGVASAVIVTRGGLPTGGLPAGLGWLGIVAIITGAAIVGRMAREPGVLTGRREPPPLVMAAFLVPTAGIVGWMVWLGLSL